ncbi:16S rRNA (uracil(1498)-N(3))-methyltransferase [Bifidobacterium choloepi]|uniref:Ribosomal RNA small subunit methyltransferase E n=1 Tax=Bifidobacterium choloepi TaxID=2614131 RepID=A0A6I5NFV8_9BIFI|nr:16S rRNA (uracil(1498)-N(3))-methyltransferase [Bifidobacterium choloepi]NEG69243.1 16S rRNA (uracil(1498)-N(3))-methyltransferase [Bifidobacterium choloepi]
MTNPLFVLDNSTDDVPMTADSVQVGWNLTLPPAIKRHAIGSMRLREGDALQLSDGHGLKINATVADAERGDVRVESFDKESRPAVRLALVQALAKNGHDEQAIDVATQIGVDEVVPWESDRSIAKWKDGKTDRKWRSVLVAATEQSRRGWLPELAERHTSRMIVARCRRACVRGGLVIVLHQDATDSWSGIEDRVREVARKSAEDGNVRTVSVVVGPEGGISDREVEEFRDAGAEVVLVGHNILRASSAGPVALALLSRVLGRIE